MTISTSVSVLFEADSPEHATAIVQAMNLPPGAAVNTTMSERVSDASGTVDEGGNLVPRPGAPAMLAELDPQSVVQNGGQVTLRALGSNFEDTAQIVFNNVELATAFQSATELTCTIDASIGGHDAGTFPVVVRQEGADTAPLNFTIAQAE